jgi:cytochrome c556
MRFKMIASILAAVPLSASTCIAADDNEEKRQKTRKMAAEALQDLYKLERTSQASI